MNANLPPLRVRALLATMRSYAMEYRQYVDLNNPNAIVFAPRELKEKAETYKKLACDYRDMARDSNLKCPIDVVVDGGVF